MARYSTGASEDPFKLIDIDNETATIDTNLNSTQVNLKQVYRFKKQVNKWFNKFTVNLK